MYAISAAWAGIREKPASHNIGEGVAPVTLGLLFSGAIVVAKGSINGTGGAVVAIAAFLIFSLTKINPLLAMGRAALAGLLGWV